MSEPTGIVVVDKPSGMTSHDVVARCRRRFGTRKVGHSGTLDPSATGVLVIGVGRATKLLSYLTGMDKTYVAGIRFGATTHSMDADGDVVETFRMDDLDLDAVEVAARQFVGELQQIPPMVSAIKIGGRRLHELAREGVTVERQPRPVTVGRFEIAPTADPMVFMATIDCSSGTYVRVLAHDLGSALGGGAHLATLRRTRVGPYSIDEAGSIEDAPLLGPLEGLRERPVVAVDAEIAAALRSGRLVSAQDLGLRADTSVAAAVDANGSIVAVVEVRPDGRVRPAVPFF